jgi:hypothetical protein
MPVLSQTIDANGNVLHTVHGRINWTPEKLDAVARLVIATMENGGHETDEKVSHG